MQSSVLGEENVVESTAWIMEYVILWKAQSTSTKFTDSNK